MSRKKIIISFDGAWSTPDSNKEVDGDSSTNVWKLHDAILPLDMQGAAQDKHYLEGVGTRWYNKIRGGVFGVGLSAKIQQGYRYLASHYAEGDQIFIFGFSRGAYSARSLVGLIRNAGLLKEEHLKRVPEAYSLYRTRDEGADSENARFFRNRYAREVDIHFLGVWDTVGALGIPVESFEWFNKAYYQFHDTELSGIVKNAYHAVAVDEHRKSYDCTLWDPKQKPNQTVQQLWFCGAHSNVGGGYADNSLSDIPLLWMAERARERGLALDLPKLPPLPAKLAPITDSYREFLGGAYSLFEPRHFRIIGATPNGQEAINPMVIQRIQLDPHYRPKNPVKANLTGDIKPLDKLFG